MSCERLQWLRQMLRARSFYKRDGSAKSFPTAFLEILHQKVADSFFAFRVMDECNHVAQSSCCIFVRWPDGQAQYEEYLQKSNGDGNTDNKNESILSYD